MEDILTYVIILTYIPYLYPILLSHLIVTAPPPRHRPSIEWLESFLNQLQVKHQVLTSAQALDVLSALPELGVVPSSGPPDAVDDTRHSTPRSPPVVLLAALFKRITPELPSASGRQLAGLLQATARLGLRPSADWVALVAEEILPQLASDMDLDALAETWWSFEALGYCPGEALGQGRMERGGPATIFVYGRGGSEGRSDTKFFNNLVFTCSLP